MYANLKPAVLRAALILLMAAATAAPLCAQTSPADSAPDDGASPAKVTTVGLHRAPGSGFRGAGASFSPDLVGICLYSRGDATSFKVYDLTLELMDVLNGHFDTPGFRFAYHYAVVLRTGVLRGGGYTLYAGPGISCGYVRERSEGRGMMAGLSCLAGVSAAFRHDIDLALEWQAYAAFRLTDPDSPSLSWYQYGLAGAWIPRLRIIKRF